MQILGNEACLMTEKTPSLLDELKKHRELALERSRLEADFKNKLCSLKRVKEILTKTPDLDVDKV